MIGLQYCLDFCHISAWINHGCTYVPSLLNLPSTPPGYYRAPVGVPWVIQQILTEPFWCDCFCVQHWLRLSFQVEIPTVALQLLIARSVWIHPVFFLPIWWGRKQLHEGAMGQRSDKLAEKLGLDLQGRRSPRDLGREACVSKACFLIWKLREILQFSSEGHSEE